MTGANPFLQDFWPVLEGILECKSLSLQKVELEIVDEENADYSQFEPCDVLDVLDQIGGECNSLTIYTDRMEYFFPFRAKMYEENGLVVQLQDKKELVAKGRGRSSVTKKILLDFEWEGEPKYEMLSETRFYIPIHKQPWRVAENLDIQVPFGYNTVIVKRTKRDTKKQLLDRFDEAFYKNE